MIKGSGTLNSLNSIRKEMRKKFRTEFTEASVSLTEDDWRQLIANSRLPRICRVYAEIFVEYPEKTKLDFQNAFQSEIKTVVVKSNWLYLSSARFGKAADLIGSEEFREALQKRINRINIEDLLNLSFLEAVNAISLLWKDRLEFRAELANHFWSIMPPAKTWDKERENVAALRFITNIARSEEFPDPEAKKLLDILRKPWSEETYLKINTLPLFFFTRIR